MSTELDLSGLSQSQLWTRLENDDPRFRELRELGWAAANGGCANTTVTIPMGRQLLVLLIEAQQYREAHAHSQELRSIAERKVGAATEMVSNVVEHCYQPDRLHCSACDHSLTLALEVLRGCRD